MNDPLAVRLRRLAEGLPVGGSVTLTRDALFELVTGADLEQGDRDLTVAEVAEGLRCSPSAVRRLLDTGEIVGYKLSGGPRASWRVPRTSLATFRARDLRDKPHDGHPADLRAWRRVRRHAGS